MVICEVNIIIILIWRKLGLVGSVQQNIYLPSPKMKIVEDLRFHEATCEAHPPTFRGCLLLTFVILLRGKREPLLARRQEMCPVRKAFSLFL